MIPASNVKDLMLRKDVVEAAKAGRFRIYAVATIDEGIEILTGKTAGAKQADGKYPEGSINDLVDRKLNELVEGIQKFGADKEGQGKSETK